VICIVRACIRAQALPPALLGRFRLDACGVSVLALAKTGSAAPASARAINATAHLRATSSAAAAPVVPMPWPAHWAALDWDPSADGSW
jgi:hypothetical protein